MVPWLATILRNQFYTEYRKYRREVADADGVHAAMLESPADQLAHVECEELHEALEKLPNDMREAIVMVGAFGLSYEEAAQSQNCPIGTIKSRVHRARTCPRPCSTPRSRSCRVSAAAAPARTRQRPRCRPRHSRSIVI